MSLTVAEAFEAILAAYWRRTLQSEVGRRVRITYEGPRGAGEQLGELSELQGDRLRLSLGPEGHATVLYASLRSVERADR